MSRHAYIDQLVSGDVTERSIEDVGGMAALTAAEAKALASGNPEIMEVVRLDTEIRRLSALESHHASTLAGLGWDIRSSEHALERTRARHEAVLEDARAARAAWSAAGERSPGVTIGRAHFHGEGYRKEAAAALETALRPLRRASLEEGGAKVEATLGTYLDFRLTATVAARREEGFHTELRLEGRERYDVAYAEKQPEGAIASLEAQAHPKHLEHVAAGLGGEVARLEHRLEGLRQEAAKPFDDGSRLAELRKQREAIVERLHLRDAPQDAPLVDDGPASECEAPEPPEQAPGLEMTR